MKSHLSSFTAGRALLASFVVYCVLIGLACPGHDQSYVRIVIGTKDRIPSDTNQWIDYGQATVCPGDQVTIWWNSKDASRASITPKLSPVPGDLPPKGSQTITPNTPGMVIYKLDANNLWPGASACTLNVAGNNMSTFVDATLNRGPIDAETGQSGWSTSLDPYVSDRLYVEKLMIPEQAGFSPDAIWKRGTQEDKKGLVTAIPEFKTATNLSLINQPPMKGKWYFTTDRPVAGYPATDAVKIRFEVFCK